MRDVMSIGLLAGLLLVACGGPAPGEGVEESRSVTTMPEIVPAPKAIRAAEISTIDLQTMNEAEYEKIIAQGSRCTFLYSSEGSPVFAASMDGSTATGAVKIHGKLVELKADNTTSFDALLEGGTFNADGLRLRVIPDADGTHPGSGQREADAILEISGKLKVGYRGWYACGQENERTPQG